MAPAGMGAVGGVLTDVALGYLEGLLKPSKADLDRERALKLEKTQEDIDLSRTQQQLNEAHAAYYGLGKSGGGNPYRIITDPATGAKIRVNILTGDRLEDLTSGKAEKESEAQQLLTEYYASQEPGAAPFPPAKRARLNMLYWSLLRPAPESGKMAVPWDYTGTSDPVGKLPPASSSAPAPAAPTPPKTPPVEATKPPPAEVSGAPKAPDATGPAGASKPPATGGRKPAGAGSGHEKRVELMTPTFEPMTDAQLTETLTNLEARQKQNPHPITAAEIDAVKGILARRWGQQSPQTPPVERKPGIADKPYPTDTAFPKEVTPDPSWLQTYETLIANRPIEDSDTHWDRLKLVKNMRPEVKAAYIEAYRKVHKKNPPGIIEGTLPSAQTGPGTATDASTGTGATGGTQTAEAPKAETPATGPKPSDRISPGASADYRRRALGEPTTSDEQAVATRKLHGQGKVGSSIFSDLPEAEKVLVDQEVQRPKNAEEQRHWETLLNAQRNQRLQEEQLEEKKREPVTKALSETMKQRLEELDKGAMTATKMDDTLAQIEGLITSAEGVYGNTPEARLRMGAYAAGLASGDQRARNTAQLRNLASQLQLAPGSLGSGVSVYDAQVYAKAAGDMQKAQNVEQMLQYMEIMRAIIRKAMRRANEARTSVETTGKLPEWGAEKLATEDDIQRTMANPKHKGKTRDQVIELLKKSGFTIEAR